MVNIARTRRRSLLDLLTTVSSMIGLDIESCRTNQSCFCFLCTYDYVTEIVLKNIDLTNL